MMSNVPPPASPALARRKLPANASTGPLPPGSAMPASRTMHQNAFVPNMMESYAKEENENPSELGRYQLSLKQKYSLNTMNSAPRETMTPMRYSTRRLNPMATLSDSTPQPSYDVQNPNGVSEKQLACLQNMRRMAVED